MQYALQYTRKNLEDKMTALQKKRISNRQKIFNQFGGQKIFTPIRQKKKKNRYRKNLSMYMAC